MKARDFCFWLQGWLELTDADELNDEQVHTIRKHLELVFVHEIDPSMGDENHQKVLNETHDPKSIMRC